MRSHLRRPLVEHPVLKLLHRLLIQVLVIFVIFLIFLLLLLLFQLLLHPAAVGARRPAGDGEEREEDGEEERRRKGEGRRFAPVIVPVCLMSWSPEGGEELKWRRK